MTTKDIRQIQTISTFKGRYFKKTIIKCTSIFFIKTFKDHALDQFTTILLKKRIVLDSIPIWCYWVHISVTMLLCWFTLKEHRDCRSFEAKKRFFQTLLEVQDNHLILNPFLNSFSTFTDLNIHPKQILFTSPFYICILCNSVSCISFQTISIPCYKE